MRRDVIINVSNPCFKRDFIKSDNTIIWLDSGVYEVIWSTIKFIGFKKTIVIKKKIFQTKEQANQFRDSLILKMFEEN